MRVGKKVICTVPVGWNSAFQVRCREESLHAHLQTSRQMFLITMVYSQEMPGRREVVEYGIVGEISGF